MELQENAAVAKLRNVRISSRKMQLVADSIRGVDVFEALNRLKFVKKRGAIFVEKLLKSAISNWELKHTDFSIEDADLFVQQVYVTQGKTLKRFQPAPQGRAHRIRKRSCHVTLVVSARENQGEVAAEKSTNQNTESKS